MIAYDDLVVALSSWRASQGLPSNAVSFLSSATGSVDLALPVAEPVDSFGTGEVQSLDGEYAVDEYAMDEFAVEEQVVDEFAVEEELEEEVASADHFDAATGEDSLPGAEPLDEAASPVHALSYDDDESEQTAIASDFEGVYDDGVSAPPSFESDSDSIEAADDEVLSVSDVEAEEVVESLSSGASAEAHTEEVDVLSEFPASEEEGPTQFGDLDREATEMGVGLDALQHPGSQRDPEE